MCRASKQHARKEEKDSFYMLIIKPVEEKKQQAALCAACGVPYREEAMAYAARVDDVLVGICQFTMNDHEGLIYDLASPSGTNDREALFIMARQTLNFIDLCGVHRACFVPGAADDQTQRFLRWIGFAPDQNNRWTMDLTDFFLEPCRRHRNHS